MTPLATLPTAAAVTPQVGDEVVVRVRIAAVDEETGRIAARTLASDVSLIVYRWDVEVNRHDG